MNILPNTSTHEFLLVSNDVDDNSPEYSVSISSSSTDLILTTGDILLVKKQDTVEHGELGIFMIDNVRQVKKMYFKDGYLRLCSLDDNGEDVDLDNVHDLKCVGKVMKVLHAGESNFTEP